MLASHELGMLSNEPNAGPSPDSRSDQGVERQIEQRGSVSQPRPSAGRAYRAILLAADGRIATLSRLDAQDDAEALVRAAGMVDGHAVELWDGSRFIAHFPPVD